MGIFTEHEFFYVPCLRVGRLTILMQYPSVGKLTDRGIPILHRLCLKSLPVWVQPTKRWVTLLAVCREGYARKNPHTSLLMVCGEVLMSVGILHPANVVQGRCAKNAVFNLSICKLLISIFK